MTGNRERLWLVLLLLGTALLSFWSLGSLPLIDVDEPVYGQVGKEMARAGWSGWLTPHYGGLPWFDKPPLFYWLTALSMRVFGVSEFAARFPSALLAVVLVAATYALTRAAFPDTPRAGLWSGFVLATCVQFFLLARAAVTDMTLAVTLTLALLGLYSWTTTGRGRWIALTGLMTGLGMLTKGPVALVLIGIQAIAYLCLTRQARRLLSPALWGGFALCLIVGLPWFLAMIHLHGRLFIDGFLEANNVTRYLQAEHQKTSSPLFFVPVLLAGFFPWSLALPGALILAWRLGRETWRAQQTDNPALFLGFWVVLVFVFFSASQSKLITYIFPLYPAAAVLAGHWLAIQAERQRTKTATRRETLSLYVPLWLYLILWTVVNIAADVFARRYGVPRSTLSLWNSFFLAFMVFVISPGPSGWVVPGLATSVFLLVAWVSPVWKTREADVSERKMAAVAAQTAPPDGVIHALGFKHPSLRYYAPQPVVYTDDHAASATDIRQHPGVVYAMRTSDEDELRRKYGVTNFEELWRYDRSILIRATANSQGH